MECEQELVPVVRCDDVTIFNLPPEILDYIFSFLSIKERLRTELVCQKWRDFGKSFKWSWPNELDVRDLINSTNTLLSDDILTSILTRCGSTLTKVVVNIERTSNLTGHVLNVVGECCWNLSEIRMHLMNLRKAQLSSLLAVATGCPKLKRVLIRQAFCLDNDALCQLLQQAPSLEYLVLVHNDVNSEQWVDALPKELKGFYSCGCRSLNFNKVAEKLVDRCDRVEELCLHAPNLDDVLLMKVIQHFSSTLATLYLVECKLKSREWDTVPALLPHLEVLSVANCTGVGDHFAEMLAEKCLKLRALCLRDTLVGDEGVSSLASLPRLRVLDLSGTYIAGEGIENLAKQGHLEELYMKRLSNYDNLVENACVVLANRCPNFRLLDVSHNQRVTVEVVTIFRSSLEQGHLKGPVSLYLSYTRVCKTTPNSDKLNLFFYHESNGHFDGVFK